MSELRKDESTESRSYASSANDTSRRERVSEEEIAELEYGRRRNRAYHENVDQHYRVLIPAGMRVLELGCGTGRLLAGLDAASGVGVDMDPRAVRAARQLHIDRPELTFVAGDIETMEWQRYEPFDFIILSDVTVTLRDVQDTFAGLKAACTPRTRLILNFHSNLWRPVFWFAEKIGRRRPQKIANWLSVQDTLNMLVLADFEPITVAGRILLPLDVPVLSQLANKLLDKLPVAELVTLAWFVVARPAPALEGRSDQPPPSVSVVVPTLNERGNIEGAFTRTPQMGRWTELVFIDGNSSDGTQEEIARCTELHGHRWNRVLSLVQQGKGKGDAVRQAFDGCRGDILMILDSDLTMPPEDLTKYYAAITSRQGEFINGCRLVYPMEDEAMRFFNILGNYFFSKVFTYLLGQPVKDTLCGTKVLWQDDYRRIANTRKFFGGLDPFGDFDLLFGAAKLNLKIVDVPIRYQARTYGEIKISRWKHGSMLLAMSVLAFLRRMGFREPQR
ncbi:MAG: glycosyltransferase [Deltaproteobacteria bacterium]|nr:glycosyltransferase [Deltaproteobacteria bacterium]